MKRGVCFVCEEPFVGETGQSVYLMWSVSTGEFVGAVHYYRQTADSATPCWVRTGHSHFSIRFERYEILANQFFKKG